MSNTSAISKKIQNSSTFGSFVSAAMRAKVLKELAGTMQDHVARDVQVSGSLYDHLLAVSGRLDLVRPPACISLPDTTSKLAAKHIGRMVNRSAGITLIIDEPVVRLEKEPVLSFDLDSNFKIDKVISDISFDFAKLSYCKIKSDALKRSVKPDSVAELIQAVQPPMKARK